MPTPFMTAFAQPISIRIQIPIPILIPIATLEANLLKSKHACVCNLQSCFHFQFSIFRTQNATIKRFKININFFTSTVAIKSTQKLLPSHIKSNNMASPKSFYMPKFLYRETHTHTHPHSHSHSHTYTHTHTHT